MTVFVVSEPTNETTEALTAHKDNRTLVEKMFYNFDPATGQQSLLPIHRVDGKENIKDYNDCILLVIGYRADDESYSGALKGKDVLVFGGRRVGRAGTGVDLVLPVDSVEQFCDLAVKAARSVAVG